MIVPGSNGARSRNTRNFDGHRASSNILGRPQLATGVAAPAVNVTFDNGARMGRAGGDLGCKSADGSGCSSRVGSDSPDVDALHTRCNDYNDDR
jgi:hypothetical protein